MKISKLLAAVYLTLSALAVLPGCGNAEMERVVAERDSLRDLAKTQQNKLSQIDGVISTISDALESIDSQQHNLFIDPTGEMKATKSQTIDNLNRFEQTIRNHRTQIAELKQRLAEQKSKNEADEESLHKAETLINHLNDELRRKDELIAQLREQIESKNFDLNQLQNIVYAQQSEIEELNEANKRFNAALARSSEMANKAFVAYGTKKELETMGIVKKGKIVTRDALDRSKFMQIDIRKTSEISFKAKKPKIITPVPQSSYTLNTNGHGEFTIQITNPSEFWSISNYLIIQTN